MKPDARGLGGTVALVLVALAGCAGTRPEATGERPLPDATRPRRLVQGGWKGSFSPDGGRIAYGLMPEGRGIAVLDLRTGQARTVSPTGKDPAWSPAGGLIAFVEDGAPGGSTGERVLVISETGEGRRLVAERSGYPAWSRDGRTLFVHDRKKGEIVEHPVAPQPGAARTVARSAFWYPALSPDGTRIASFRADAVIVERASGEEDARWPAPGVRGGLAAFSPDGQLLAFGGFPGSPVGLWVLDLGRMRAVQVVPGPFTLPAWSPDGSYLAFDRREGSQHDLWLLGRATIDRCLRDRAISADELGLGAGACD